MAQTSNQDEDRTSATRWTQPCRSQVITLQTTGGPLWWGQKAYGGAGVSTVISVGTSIYLVDAADGISARWAAAGLKGSPGAEKLQRLRAAFITHMHTDHISGLPVLMAQGSNPAGAEDRTPLPLFGPFPIEASEPPPNAPPGSSGPPRDGIVELFDKLDEALSVDLRTEPRRFMRPVALQLPASVAAVASPANPFPPMDPFVVYEDEEVTVRAVLVNHFYPSFAYRFDTTDGSVVISGDTASDTNGNLERLGAGADALLLEVILDDEAFGVSYLDELYGPPPYPPEAQNFRSRFSAIHIDSSETGRLAQSVGAGMLVLHHLAPPPRDGRTRRKYRDDAARHFGGPIFVARDLSRYCLDGRRGSKAEAKAPGTRP